jgi:hypothetical protein
MKAAEKLAAETLAKFKGSRARASAIKRLEDAAGHLRSTDESNGKSIPRDEAERLQNNHDCKLHKECGFGEEACRFYVLTIVDFCEHCGALPKGSVGYLDGGIDWCIACGEGMIDEGPTVQS